MRDEKGKGVWGESNQRRWRRLETGRREGAWGERATETDACLLKRVIRRDEEEGRSQLPQLCE